MSKVILTKGLPASGKSTWARGWVAKKPTARVRVNKDDLREALHGGKFSKGNERDILDAEEAVIIRAVSMGRDVVVDNTHLATNKDGSNKNWCRIKEVLNSRGFAGQAEMVWEEFDLDPEECIKRDLQRERSVGQDVIWRMYWDHVAAIEEPDYSSDYAAIMVDVDGTLAEMNGRGPFDWSRVGSDLPRRHVVNMVKNYHELGYHVIILTGRDGSCENETRQWLADHGVPYDDFYIRPAGDNRKDYIIKREIYEKHIKGKYEIELVIDDRPQVIREWRRLGLPVINVNPIDREF